MPTSQEIIKQAQKWMIDGQFIEHTGYSIDDLAKILNNNESIHGYITAIAKAPPHYSSFGYTPRWAIILKNKRLMLLSKGDGKSIYVDSVVSRWEIDLETILSVKKIKACLEIISLFTPTKM